MTGAHAEGERSAAASWNSGIMSTGPHANNLIVQLSDAIQPASVEAPPGTHNLPPGAGELFVGREEALAELARRLAAEASVVVHGLGGVGKTELALRFARDNLAEYCLVWWVSAETGSLLTDGLAALACRLTGLSALVDGHHWAVGWLQTHPGWLLVLDNCEDSAVVSDLLGGLQGHGRVVVTSRRDLAEPVWRRIGLAPLRLHVLERAASVRLLRALTGQPGPDEDADQLAAALGDLPLALEQAGAFIAQEGWTIARYRQELASRPGSAYRLAAEGFNAQRTVDRVWEMTMASAAARAPRASWVMSVLAWLAPEPLPASVLTRTDAGDGDEQANSDRAHPVDDSHDSDDDRDAVQQAVRVLASYSMIGRAADTVKVHRLVQAVTRGRDKHASAHRQAAARRLAAALAANPWRHPESWPMWRRLLPHIEELVRSVPVGESDGLLMPLLDKAADYMRDQGLAGRAIPLAQQLVARRSAALGPSHPDTLQSQADLADTHRHAGQVDTAITLYTRVVDERSRALGGDHRDTLQSRDDLASCYLMAGQVVEATTHHERVFADRVRVLGEVHRDTLTSLAGLAITYQHAGRLDDALLLLRPGYADAVRVYGRDDGLGSNIRLALAGAYQMAGRPDLEIPLREQIAADLQASYGRDYLMTIAAQTRLAGAYLNAGRLGEAIALYEQSVADNLRVLGPISRRRCWHSPNYGLSRSRVLVTRLTAPFSGVPAIAPCGRVVGFLRRWGRFHPHLGVGQSLPLGRRW
ncbi:MAG TPA: tetratricopeptide repeat protein [Rugosimonospora sp.]